MVISEVDTDEVIERWQFDIQCEKNEQTENKKGAGFVTTMLECFKILSVLPTCIIILIHTEKPYLFRKDS